MSYQLKVLIFLLYCILQGAQLPARAEDMANFSKEDQIEQVKQLEQGMNLLRTGNPSEAILFFEKVSKSFEDKYKNSKDKIYGARNSNETLLYMLKAASDKQGAIAVSANWAYAYFYKAYALLELKKTDEGSEHLKKALDMMPENAHFLAEMGHIHQINKNWEKQIETFQHVEKAVELEPENKSILLPRAWRGISFAYIEQGKLTEAEGYLNKCLTLNPNDNVAKQELIYIQKLKLKN